MGLNQNEKLIKNMERMEKTMEKITARDECIKIIQTIWSCKNAEQKDGCYKMFETYKNKHGEENVGVTFIEIELTRLEHIIKIQTERAEQMKAAQERQKAAMEAEAKENPPQPMGTNGKVVPINAKENKK